MRPRSIATESEGPDSCASVRGENETFIVTLPSDALLDRFHEILNEELAFMGMHVHIAPIAAVSTAFKSKDSEPFVITTKGPDRKGLVAGISATIARYGVNITNLQAVFKGGDDPGNNIMIYEVDVPGDIDQINFCRELRETAESLALNISIQHRNIFESINRI